MPTATANLLQVDVNNGLYRVVFNLSALSHNNQMRVGDIDVVVVEIANMGQHSPYMKEYGIKAENIKNGDKGIERIVIDTRRPAAHTVSISTGHIDEINNVDVIQKMSQRMYFLEELTDLWVGGHIDKDRYAKFRKLFKTNEREFAIKMVHELYTHHVKN